MSDKDTADKAKGTGDTTAPSGLNKTDQANTNQDNANPDKTNQKVIQESPDREKAIQAGSGQKASPEVPNPDERGQPDKPAATSKKSASAKTRRGGRPWRWMLLLIILLAGAASVGLWYWQQMQQRQQQHQQQQSEQATARVDALQEQLAASEARLAELAREQQQLRQAQTEQAQQLAEQLQVVEQQLSYHGNRLRALSTTTREDWLLAEAEYLLKLASQRLMVERNTDTAQGLLQQADNILRDIEDPQLRPLRRAIAADLTKLKLASDVDLEGLYLRLASLAESVHELPTMPSGPNAVVAQAQRTEDADPTATETEQGWWPQVKRTFGNMFSGLDDYVRIRDHADEPAAILPPDAAQFLEQNLRLMLERAQLAAMREEAELYQRSLASARQWVRRYYPETRQRENFVAAISELATVNVWQELPDISQSLQMLSNYIDRLHNLNGAGDAARTDAGDEAEGQP